MYAPSRSCIADLHEGATDGTYKKYAVNRGGFVEGVTALARREMSGVYHGFNERANKLMPNGAQITTPNYVDIAAMDSENV
jgi:hypothetical protein